MRVARGLSLVLVGLAAGFTGTPAAQQAGVYPSRTVQIVVPYTPGTGADILSRLLGPRLHLWRSNALARIRKVPG